MEKVKIPEDIISYAADLLSAGVEDSAIIKIHHLTNEEEQYDDELIDSIIQSFTLTLKELASELSKLYGQPKLTEAESDLDEETEEEFYIPGSFSSAVWEKDECILYLAVCQEDREYPITLVIGVMY